MSFLFSRALVEEYSPLLCLACAPFAPSNGTPTPQAYSLPDRTTEPCQPSRYGMTCARLTVATGVGPLISFLEAFPARRTAAHLEGVRWQTISGRKCDGSWQMSLPGSYLPRTPSDARSIAQQMTSKRWVTKSDACSFPRQTWVLTTFGPDTGFLHTPTHTANYACASMQKWPNCREFVRVFGKPDPTNHEWLMGWPIGWTDLKPLGMDKFQSWQSLHFSPSLKRLSEAALQPHPDPKVST